MALLYLFLLRVLFSSGLEFLLSYLLTYLITYLLIYHVNRNYIITPEQAAGKKGVWGTIKQLVISKNILSEVRNMKRNLYTVWLDYKKIFNSVSHSWLIRALKLLKVPKHLMTGIKNLTKSWFMKL